METGAPGGKPSKAAAGEFSNLVLCRQKVSASEGQLHLGTQCQKRLNMKKLKTEEWGPAQELSHPYLLHPGLLWLSSFFSYQSSFFGQITLTMITQEINVRLREIGRPNPSISLTLHVVIGTKRETIRIKLKHSSAARSWV